MTAPNNRERILPRLIDDEIKESFINYSMSVIVSRALPDVRDGLKPVHRRVLYAMNELGLVPGPPVQEVARRSSATCSASTTRTATQSVYDALVRMVQDFSLRYPLVDGQGNFGSRRRRSRGGVPLHRSAAHAASRWRCSPTSTRTPSTSSPNFDDRLEEPKVLPVGDPEPARQRIVGHRGRHGDEHPAAQPAAKSSPRSSQLIDNPEHRRRRHPEAHQGSRLPDGRLHLRPRRHQGLSGDGPRPHRHARARRDRGEGIARTSRRSSSPSFRIRSTARS